MLYKNELHRTSPNTTESLQNGGNNMDPNFVRICKKIVHTDPPPHPVSTQSVNQRNPARRIGSGLGIRREASPGIHFGVNPLRAQKGRREGTMCVPATEMVAFVVYCVSDRFQNKFRIILGNKMLFFLRILRTFFWA